MAWRDYIPTDVRDLYEVHDYHHAAAVLANEFPSEFNELMAALRRFRLSCQDIATAGGNDTGEPLK